MEELILSVRLLCVHEVERKAKVSRENKASMTGSTFLSIVLYLKHRCNMNIKLRIFQSEIISLFMKKLAICHQLLFVEILNVKKRKQRINT